MSLKIRDLNLAHRPATVTFHRRHDDPEDPRKDQPVLKTKPRVLTITDELAQGLERWIDPTFAPSLSESGPSFKPVVLVSWSATTYATTYQVEETHPVNGVTPFYNGPNLQASQLILGGGSIKFRVRSCNAVGCSAWSPYSTITL